MHSKVVKMNRILSRNVLFHNIKQAATIKQPKRFSGHGVWSYRVPPPPPSKRATMLAEGLGGICWFWILWHCLTEPEHIYGEWPYVKPCTWSDEELGIPRDAEGPLKSKK